jgi:hypothetical protein
MQWRRSRREALFPELFGPTNTTMSFGLNVSVAPPEKVAEEIETDTGGKEGALKSTGRENPALTAL